MDISDKPVEASSTLSSTDSRENSSTENSDTNIQSLDRKPYSMNVRGRKRGLALIFSHENFKAFMKLKKRTNSEVDYNRLKPLLENLGFEVKIHLDSTVDRIFAELLKELSLLGRTATLRLNKIRVLVEVCIQVKEATSPTVELSNLHLFRISNMNHSDHECLAIFVMTHGKLGSLAAYDDFYNVGDLWSYFTKRKCPSLKGKPKLFFTQACRGINTDAGIYMELRNANYNQPSLGLDTSDALIFRKSNDEYEAEYIETPDESDFLIAYATVPDHISYKQEISGSWFIQDLCKILEKFVRKYDLLTLLTLAAQRIAVNRVSNSPDTVIWHNKKQIPCTVHTLVRPLYFYPEEAEEVPTNLELYDPPLELNHNYVFYARKN